jgi:hypothetical protein
MKRKNEEEATNVVAFLFLPFFSRFLPLVRHCRVELINNGDQDW